MPAHLRTPLSFRLALCAALVAAAPLAAPATARAATATFAISGRGWGHGIGMTQYGAKGYAEKGETYTWILAHYFQKTAIATRSELTVKVDLDASKAARSSWRICAASTSATLTVTDFLHGAHVVPVAHGVNVWITFSGGGAVLRKDKYDSSTKKYVAGSVIATFPAQVVVATGSTKSSQVKILGASGPFSSTGVTWRGQIRFTPNTTTGHAIDYVPMEQYLRSVVPCESPSTWPKESLRAQAVAARSYAYGSASSGSTLACTTSSQVYGGVGRERASTDAAVADTADKVVVYGSTVVKTFFSSSSGGRTANSKDVWFSSRTDTKSPVYYTSVTDADSASPNYHWSLADMSGTTLAGKIRGYSSSLSHASPATVTAVTLEAGTSGFVRYVTLHWSKGAATVMTGPQFESALRLKSSAFSVKLKTPPPPAPKRYEDTDAHMVWTGSFASAKTASASGGSYRHSSVKGSKVTVMFKGTTFSWIGRTSTGSGKADVYFDGKLSKSVDLYATSTHYKVTLWTKTGLSASATHTVTVNVLDTHRSAAKGSGVGLDAIDVRGTLVTAPKPPVWKRYQQNTSLAGYSGTWATSSLTGLSGGTHAYSHETSAAVVFRFSGSRVRWIGKRAINYGKAWVSVDSAAAVLVDLYSGKTLNQQTLFESGALAAGTHRLTVRVAGKKNSKSTYHYVDVDAFEALQPAK